MAEQLIIDAQHPWPWLEAFPEYAADFFNGRDEDAEALLRRVLAAPVTVLFGKSGLGKSSLLQAGLFPGLRKERRLPIYVRLAHESSSISASVQIAKRLSEEIKRTQDDTNGFTPLTYRLRQDTELKAAEMVPLFDTLLWERLHRTDIVLADADGRCWNPVFVLDQFEEIFTLATDPERQKQTFYELGDLIENRIPKVLAESLRVDDKSFDRLNLDTQNYQFLISLREDYLPDLEEWADLIPQLKQNRYRLMPMSKLNAIDAVEKTGGSLVDHNDAENIVNYLSLSQAPEMPGVHRHRYMPRWVEPALLSLICSGLNHERLKNHQTRLATEDLAIEGGLIIERFYDEAFENQPDSLRDFVQMYLITPDGVRLRYPVQSVLNQKLATLAQIEILEKRRLIRRVSIEEGDFIELIHDCLLSVVKRRKAEFNRSLVENELRTTRKVVTAGLDLTLPNILSGSVPFPELQQIKVIVAELKGELNFGRARELLEKAKQENPNEDEAWVVLQLALCTYKDEELYPQHRLKAALALLESIGLRNSTTTNSETLALGGAVYKRLWEFDGQLDNLYESLAFYRAAYERNPQQDMGYGGLNAAYLLDVLAARAESLERRSGLTSREAPELRKEAEEIRRNVRDQLLSQQNNSDLAGQYWFVVTLGEACFGMGDYSEAAQWLDKARQAPDVTEWQLQTTFRQLVGLARQQHIDVPAEKDEPEQWHPAWQTLQHLLGDGTAEALTCYRGKVGLAMSGGGFRASFFHLGVLARLAEVDALRGVDVLSTVSGGSILGAQYYLEVQNLLQDPGKKLTRDDYLDVVVKLQKDFLQGVQTNIRMGAFNNFIDNVRMLFSTSYSRSHKLGELYEKHLYSRVADGKSSQQRIMPDLLVQPAHGKFQGTTFKPKFHNWRRRAKVPVLLLNTTSLNSGHNWFFTASWMGEPPGLVSEEIDCNERYRRLYYHEAPDHLKKFRLGYAAAASSCVPGLFEPLMLDKLYENRSVKLVDGGVHDNQGVQGLLDEGCTLILCSDACGQMGNVANPAEDPGSVLLRTTSVLQARVREAEYQDLQARLDSRALQGLFFIHTQKELASKPLDWLTCPNPSPAKADEPLTSYGIAKDLQSKIAGLRTDLDSFTEVEASALMASGYLMTGQQLKDLDEQHRKDGKPGTWGDFDINAAQKRAWEFLKLKDVLAEKPGEQVSEQRKDLALQLQVGSILFFKVWQLVPWLKFSGYAAAGVVALVLIKLIVSQWQSTLFSLSVGGLILALLGVLAALFLPAMRWLNPKKEVNSLVIKVAIALTGYFMAKVHLNIIDPLFIARGKLDRLLKLGKKN